MTQLINYFPREPLWTPEIQRVSEVVAEWVANDMAGGHVWGLPRIGKTDFGRFLNQALFTILNGDVTTVRWDFSGPPVTTPDAVLQRCLTSSGCADALGTRKRAALQMRLVDYTEERCQRASASRVVAILDEMQNVPHDLYPVFMSLTADLQHAGLMPHVLSIGQTEMAQTVKLMYDNSYLQTIGRFFPKVEIFQALSVQHVAEMLSNMEGTTRTFTQRVFPERAQAGWSLKKISEILEPTSRLLMERWNLTAPPRLPFGWLRPALNSLFRKLSLDSSIEARADMLVECLTDVGFDSVAGYYVD